jgi:uroporphyrinogen-III synthase
MRLLITRPEPDAARSADALRKRGHEVVVAPLLYTQAIDADFGGPFAGALITSANAARAFASHRRAEELRRLPVFTVGARSAQAAREAGFAEVMSADGALADLVRLVAQRLGGRELRLIYLAGEDRAGDLVGDLSAHGVAVDTVVVYRAVAREALPAEVAQGLASLDGALHYSPRSVATLLRLAGHAGVLAAALRLAHYGLSDEVAAPLRAAGAERIFIAASPTESALFALLRA